MKEAQPLADIQLMLLFLTAHAATVSAARICIAAAKSCHLTGISCRQGQRLASSSATRWRGATTARPLMARRPPAQQQQGHRSLPQMRPSRQQMQPSQWLGPRLLPHRHLRLEVRTWQALQQSCE